MLKGTCRICGESLMGREFVKRLLSLVPKAGLEPARLAPHAPQTCVSAIPPLRQPRVSPSKREAKYTQARRR